MFVYVAGLDTSVQDHVNTTLDFLDARLSTTGRRFQAVRALVE